MYPACFTSVYMQDSHQCILHYSPVYAEGFTSVYLQDSHQCILQSSPQCILQDSPPCILRLLDPQSLHWKTRRTASEWKIETLFNCQVRLRSEFQLECVCDRHVLSSSNEVVTYACLLRRSLKHVCPLTHSKTS